MVGLGGLVRFSPGTDSVLTLTMMVSFPSLRPVTGFSPLVFSSNKLATGAGLCSCFTFVTFGRRDGLEGRTGGVGVSVALAEI